MTHGHAGFEPKTFESVLFLPIYLSPSLRARPGGVSAAVSVAGYTDITMRVASIAPCLGSGTRERERSESESESDNVDRERERERSDKENPFALKPWLLRLEKPKIRSPRFFSVNILNTKVKLHTNIQDVLIFSKMPFD